MNRVFLLTGSNIGDSNALIDKAVDEICRQLGLVVQKSHIYRSESWGYKSSQQFLNQCIEIETELGPQLLIDTILEIEEKMGRVRTSQGYSDRKIDIDILFFNNEIIEDDRLSIPHPRFHLRKFALLPMAEIAGDFVHPLLKKKVSELLISCEDASDVTMDLNH